MKAMIFSDLSTSKNDFVQLLLISIVMGSLHGVRVR